ncbi:hypothetical protein SODALDRAFT_334274 [Sodiomyces alkalinus F11]|uniref:Uncharacterized protein n=1 Tax=Sodiomyces alkalinus (strain CBS 110278 / VKM F-3762 / F11) TaxID=1314773 RepID=A0A3N2PS87_SODAK|nr:hypothetical protein SODALDRAFT_334274 [Sodiomyces alkalinus F11]ROT37196.1 hypothetical protein SODALDRAFT_334274 [Sodiomyces alkalinus F11]
MPSVSSGRITKARKGKKLTPHQKNHRWESFQTKIAKLHSLDPLRKVRRHDLDAEDLEATTSYFRNGLERWNELNISRGFVSFKREVLPLTESLAQILHFETRIFELLTQYISMQEKEALEPLLDLLTAFAHDLGIRFEKHYAASLGLVAAIAAKPQDVEVIEWAFAALAFLFKYLSRLIVPNLRPTYDVLAPLLGKTRHPPYIARFAAEATSFLIKKAAAPANRETALVSIVTHARDDLLSMAGERQFQLYQDGIMTMFSEAMKGPGETLHSTAQATLKALLGALPAPELELSPDSTWSNVICGVLTSVIHHSNATSFAPLEEAILEEANLRMAEQASDGPWRFVPLIRAIGTVAGVRAGSRMSNWSSIVRCLVSMMDWTTKRAPDVSSDQANLVWKHIVSHTAIVWHAAPMDALIPGIKDFTNSLQREPFMRWFIPFCAYLSDLDSQRFRSLFQSYFQRFVGSHWSEGHNDDELCIFLPKMVKAGSLPAPGEKETWTLPRGWQDQIVAKFERLEVSPFPERGTYDKDPQTWRDRCLPKYSMLLDLLDSTTVHPSATAKIADLLLRKLKLALRPTSSLASDEVHFSISQGFHAYLRMSKVAGPVDPGLEPLLRAALPRFSRSIGFLEAYLTYEQLKRSGPPVERRDSSSSSEGSKTEVDPVVKALVDNLSSPSHELRLATLNIFAKLESTTDESSCLALMTQIEETPLELGTLRVIAMHIRKLGQTYSSLSEGSWLRLAVPAFLFGMMTVKLTPLWKDACAALEQVGHTKSGEEAILTLALDWLDVPSSRSTGPGGPLPGQTRRPLTEFDCTHLQKLTTVAEDVHNTVESVLQIMLEYFDKQQQPVETHPFNARSQALKVLAALPALAEKRSRKIVPYFLSWATESTGPSDSRRDEEDKVAEDDEGAEGEGEEEEEEEEEDEDRDEGDAGADSWSLYDRKAMLAVFEKFVNPKSLYESEKVYQALLHQLENGDIDVQKSALKSILTWKQEGIKPYQENLEYLLDEARFKNELTVLLQGEQAIQAEHRPELMPVLLRLLYGRTISKKGAASGRHGLAATRLAVLRNLSAEDLGGFLDIALGKLRGLTVLDDNNSGLREDLFSREILAPRKQVGFMNMMLPLINELGTDVESYIDRLLNSVLYCVIYACRKLRELAAESDADQEEEKGPSHQSLFRVTRTTGLKCLHSLSRNAPNYAWTRYVEIITAEVVSPRIENLPAENTQGVSGLLQLLSIWSQLPKAALFLSINSQILPKIIECVSVEKAKDEVKIFCLGIVRNLIGLVKAPASQSEFNELIKAELLDPNTDLLLRHITAALKSDGISTSLLDACLETVVDISPLVETSENVNEVLQISIFLLNQPPRRVNPKAKGQVLLILEQFVTLHEANGVDLGPSSELFSTIFETVSALFSYFKDRENRQSLSRLMVVLSGKDAQLELIASICTSMNAFAEGRIDEPDYDRRLSGFNQVSGKDGPFTARQWLPLLHNMVFYLRADEEFGILSSNSADGMRTFIQEAAASEDEDTKKKFGAYLDKIILPALYSGAREPSATVRRECLRIFGYLLSRMPTWHAVSDLKGLLTEADEESSEPAFFFNILSPATSRQLEALQLLETANEASEFSSQNLYHFFIPVLEHFIFGRTDGSDDHGLGAQASATIGNLAMSLEWKHYRVVLQRYIGFVESKPGLQKQVVRLLGKVADALVSSSQLKHTARAQPEAGAEAQEQTQEQTREQKQAETDESGDSTSPMRRLPSSMPDEISADISNNFLPTLLKHLNHKDESEVSHRVPVGIIIVKLLKLLPEGQMGPKLAGVLTDICHILRSKGDESRDMARDTLVQIAGILGPSFFGFILKELRGALKRGYQLHVLSYTLHSILLKVIPEFRQGDLDYCLPPIVAVIIDDIFGVTGQEKDAEGYTSQMKEVKSSKSQDSMELISKSVSVNHLIHLIHPLQSLLMQKLDLRMVRKIDGLLTRITTGLLQNPAAESRDTLVFCYEVVQEVYKSRKPEEVTRIDPRVKKYLYQKGVRKSERESGNRHTYKLTRFALDVLRSVWKKYDSLRSEANISGFVPILGDAVVAGEEDVKVAAFKLLTAIVKVPFGSDEGTGLYKVATKEATKSISLSATTASDLSQSALKLVSVVLRDRRDVVVKDAAIDMLVAKLKDDLTDPLYRHVTFNFLRSVLDRKIETANVYDTLDYVGTVMITNDDKDTRDLARGAFFQFLREYPQKKARWAKQLNFIVANLKYDRDGGRLSVMEIIHLLLRKSSDDFVQEIVATCFLPVIFVVANDESDKCRLAAGELVKEIFRRADRERMKTFLALLRSWLDQDDNPAVLGLGVRAFGFFFEAREASDKDKKEVKLVLGKIGEILGTGDIRVADEDLINTTLKTTQILTQAYPAQLLGPTSRDLWVDIRNCLTHPEGSVKLSAARVLSPYLADFGAKPASAGETMSGSHGLELGTEDVQELVRLAMGALRTVEQQALDDDLAAEVTQMLIFLGPRMQAKLRDAPVADALAGDGGAGGEDEEEEEEEEARLEQRGKDLQYLLWKLSSMLRRAVRATSAAMTGKVAAMEVLETICRRVPDADLAPSLKTILYPLQSITDPAISTPFSLDEGFKAKHEAVRGRAQVLMDALQKKFGTAEYSRTLLAIREEVRARRQARSSKRRIEAVTQPEKYSRDKRKKTEKKKEKKKVKAQEYKTYRQSFKQW